MYMAQQRFDIALFVVERDNDRKSSRFDHDNIHIEDLLNPLSLRTLAGFLPHS